MAANDGTGLTCVLPRKLFRRASASDFSELFLDFADRFLSFSLDLLAGIAFDRADHVVYFSTNLFRLTGGYVFASHEKLLEKRII